MDDNGLNIGFKSSKSSQFRVHIESSNDDDSLTVRGGLISEKETDPKVVSLLNLISENLLNELSTDLALVAMTWADEGKGEQKSEENTKDRDIDINTDIENDSDGSETSDNISGGDQTFATTVQEFLVNTTSKAISDDNINTGARNAMDFNAVVNVESVSGIADAERQFQIATDKMKQQFQQLQSQSTTSNQWKQSSTHMQAKPDLYTSKANEIGLRLDKFDNDGLKEQVAQELGNMLENSRKQGIYSYFSNVTDTFILSDLTTESITIDTSSIGAQSNSDNLVSLFQKGVDISSSLICQQGSADTFPHVLSQQMQLEISTDPTGGMLSNNENAENVQLDLTRLEILAEELRRADEDRHEDILEAYKELYLSPNILQLLKSKNQDVLDSNQRRIYGKITDKVISTVSQLAELIQIESAIHLEVIQAVCRVASLYQDNEMKFLEEMDLLKPKFTESLLSYIRFAIQNEEYSLQMKGVDPTVSPSSWLKVLTVVYNGILAELEARFSRLIEPLFLVLRFEDSQVQMALFERVVAKTPAVDLPYLKALSLNMVENISNQQSKHQEVSSGGDSSNVNNGVEQKQLVGVSIADTESDDVDDDSNKKKDILLSTDMSSPYWQQRATDFRRTIESYLSDDYIRERLNEFRGEVSEIGASVHFARRNSPDEIVDPDELSPDALREKGLGVSVLDVAK